MPQGHCDASLRTRTRGKYGGWPRPRAFGPYSPPRESFGSLSVHLPAYAAHKSPEGASALLIRLPAPDYGRESTQMAKPTEGGGAVYLSFISALSQLCRGFIVVGRGFTPRYWVLLISHQLPK